MSKNILISLCFSAFSILSQPALANSLFPGVCEDQPIENSSEIRYHPMTEGKPDQQYSAVPNNHSYTIVTDTNYWNDCMVDSVQADNHLPVVSSAQDISCPDTSCLGHQ